MPRWRAADTVLGRGPAGCGGLAEHPTFDRHCPFSVEMPVTHPDGDHLALVSPFPKTNCFCSGGCPPAVPLGTDHVHTGLIDSLRRSLSDFVHHNCGHPITNPLGGGYGLGDTSPGKTTGSATANRAPQADTIRRGGFTRRVSPTRPPTPGRLSHRKCRDQLKRK